MEILNFFLLSDRELSKIESGEQNYENQVVWIKPANIRSKSHVKILLEKFLDFFQSSH